MPASPGCERRRAAASRTISEIYSPPGVPHATSSMLGCALPPGLALDLTCVDRFDGKPWDLDFADEREQARSLSREQKPAVLPRVLHSLELLANA